jgi:hypothetical protein
MSKGRSVPGLGQSGPQEPQVEAVTLFRISLGHMHFQFDIRWVADLLWDRRFSASC